MINNVVLVGRLTKDADLRYTGNGTAVGTFNLAVERSFSGSDGQKQTDFIACVVWRKQAETLVNYTRKGSLIGVTGRLQSRSYDNQQGQKVYVTEVVVDEFQFLETKAQSEQRQQQSQNNTGGSGYSGGYSGNQNQTGYGNQSQAYGSSQSQAYGSNQNRGYSGGGDMPNFERDAADPFGAGASSIDISDDDLPF